MRVILQRVTQASVTVEDQVISKINQGLLILLGIEAADTPDDITWLVNKITKIRIFDDPHGKMNRSLQDLDGQALVVSQFTLHASTKKGNRPSFLKAARPEQAKPLYNSFCKTLSAQLSTPVGQGQFGAMMQVTLINDGPVTITIDSQARE